MRPSEYRLGASQIQHKGFNFLITDMPADHAIASYIEELKKYNVTAVVRVCQPSYSINEIAKEGIEVFDLVYADGMFPSKFIIQQWFELVKKHHNLYPECCVAVHCVAGLGRAPVMVALSLIELGMQYEEAVETIRLKRRGAINAKQLAHLEKYRPKSYLRHKKRACVLM